MEVLNHLADSIKVYFNTLTQLGYGKQGDIDKLLVYIFIEELLTGEMRYFLTEDDYKLLEQTLHCLYGSSCLIPYPQYITENCLSGHAKGNGIALLRITEDNNIRFTEDNQLRLKASSYNR